METAKSFFDSFKEFIWDIIGYLLPGSFLIILTSVCISDKYFVSSSLLKNDKDGGMFMIIFIILSYLLGHAVHGLGAIKETMINWGHDKKLWKKVSYAKLIRETILKSNTFKNAKDLMDKDLQAKGCTNLVNTSSFSEVRDLAMSFSPESDQKIYTFMFRSELSNKTANISILFGVFGILLFLFKKIFGVNDVIAKVDLNHLFLYGLLIIAYLLLRQTRDRFFDIAMKIPFSIYIAKKIV